VELPATRDDAAHAIKLLRETKSEKMHLESRLSKLMEKCALEASHSRQKQSDLQEQLAALKQRSRNLQKRCNRMPDIKAKAIKRAKDYANKETELTNYFIKECTVLKQESWHAHWLLLLFKGICWQSD